MTRLTLLAALLRDASPVAVRHCATDPRTLTELARLTGIDVETLHASMARASDHELASRLLGTLRRKKTPSRVTTHATLQ